MGEVAAEPLSPLAQREPIPAGTLVAFAVSSKAPSEFASPPPTTYLAPPEETVRTTVSPDEKPDPQTMVLPPLVTARAPNSIFAEGLTLTAFFPAAPWGPGAPGGPAAPAAPESPAVPADPADPAGPAGPEEPEDPEGPVGPVHAARTKVVINPATKIKLHLLAISDLFI